MGTVKNRAIHLTLLTMAVSTFWSAAICRKLSSPTHVGVPKPFQLVKEKYTELSEGPAITMRLSTRAGATNSQGTNARRRCAALRRAGARACVCVRSSSAMIPLLVGSGAGESADRPALSPAPGLGRSGLWHRGYSAALELGNEGLLYVGHHLLGRDVAVKHPMDFVEAL